MNNYLTFTENPKLENINSQILENRQWLLERLDNGQISRAEYQTMTNLLDLEHQEAIEAMRVQDNQQVTNENYEA